VRCAFELDLVCMAHLYPSHPDVDGCEIPIVNLRRKYYFLLIIEN